MHPLSMVYAALIAYAASVANNVTRHREFKYFGTDNIFLSAGTLLGIFLFDRVAAGLAPDYPGFSLWSGVAGAIGAFVVLGISYLPPIRNHLAITVINDNQVELDPDVTRPAIRR
jgi:hypothetical protein